MTKYQKPVARAQSKYTDYQVRNACTLIEFLQEKMPEASRSKLKSFLTRRVVFVNKATITHPDYPLERGMTVQLQHGKHKNVEFKGKDINVLYEDAYLMVIDKKVGVSSITTGKNQGKSAHAILSHHLKKSNRNANLFLIHKLDRDESGLMIFAKDEETKFNFQKKWREIIINHTFVGLVEGENTPDSGVIASWMDPEMGDLRFSQDLSKSPEDLIRAITRFKTIKRANGLTMMELDTREDRNNKIRIQMAHLGFPLLGDRKYGALVSPLRRIALHAFLLRFRHPVTRELLKFEVPYPKDFRALVTKTSGSTNEEI